VSLAEPETKPRDVQTCEPTGCFRTINIGHVQQQWRGEVRGGLLQKVIGQSSKQGNKPAPPIRQGQTDLANLLCRKALSQLQRLGKCTHYYINTASSEPSSESRLPCERLPCLLVGPSSWKTGALLWISAHRRSSHRRSPSNAAPAV